MSNLKKHSLLIILAMLILLAIPMSFASDISEDTNTTMQADDASVDEIGIDDFDEIQTSYDFDVLSATPLTLNVDETSVSIEEGGSGTISGKFTYSNGVQTFDYKDSSLRVKCTYNDANSNSQTKYAWTSTSDGKFSFDLSSFEGLSSGSSYILTLVGEDYYGNLEMQGTYELSGNTVDVTLTVTDSSGSDQSSITYPEYDTFTPTETYYVDSSVENDGDGSELSPYKYISSAINAKVAYGKYVELVISEGNYVANAVEIKGNVILTGKGKVVITTDSNTFLFRLYSSYNIQFNNINFENGVGSTDASVIKYNGGSDNGRLNIINCTFTENTGKYLINSQVKTTILSSTFINNKATSLGRIIQIDSRSLTVNFCNFINNTADLNIIGTSANSNNAGNANYNFFGTNTKPTASMVQSYIPLDKWTVIDIDAPEEVDASETAEVNVAFKITDGTEYYDFNALMPSLDVTIIANSGSISKSLVTLENNMANTQFTPDSSVDTDLITVKYDTNTITSKNVAITSSSASEPVYMTTPTVEGASSVDYTKGNSLNVKVIVSHSQYLDLEEDVMGSMNVYVDGNMIYTYSDANGLEEFTFDLALLSDLTAGEHNITFHPNPNSIFVGSESDYVFNNLTVNVIVAPEPEIKYNSTPSVSSVDYLINNHSSVSVTVDCDLLNQFESEDKLYAWIGDVSKEINVMANEASFTVDLKDLSDKFGFKEGQTYTVYFHPDIDTLKGIGIKDGEYVFNPLTVTVTGTYTPEAAVVYNSTPKADGKSNIEYTIGENTIVTVNIIYDAESYGSHDGFKDKHMRMFINDDTLGIVLSGIGANATSFTVDLADYITSEGEYNISFTPGDSVLSWVFYSVDNPVIIINNLAVKAVKGSDAPVKPTYNTTIDSSSPIEYTIGNDKTITVIINYDAAYANATLPVYIYINDNEGIVINDIKANATSFTINLADYALAEGENNITFHPNATDLSNIAEGEFKFGKITVNAVKTTLITPEIKIETNTPSFGENATVTVTLSENVTGNVTITVGKNNPQTVNLTKGVAVLNVANLAIGEYNVTVTYNGDENYTQTTKNSTLTVSKKNVIVNNDTFVIPEDTNSPTYSIKLPSDATGNFTVSVDGKDNYTEKLVNGTASITLSNLAVGKHNVTVSYSGDGNYSGISANVTLNVPEPVVKLSNNKNINMLYSANAVYKVLITVDGKAVGAGEKVTVKFNGATKTLTTDKNGYIAYKIPTVKPKKAKYAITATYKGKTVKNTVKVNSIIKAKNVKVKKSKKVTKVKVTLKKVNGKFLKGKTLKLKLKGKTLKAKTNKKGVATFKVKKNVVKKLKVGKKYKFKVTYGKDSVTKKITIKK